MFSILNSPLNAGPILPPLSGISTWIPQQHASLSTYQTRHITPCSLPAPPCSNLLLLWSFCSRISSPSSYCPSRIPRSHPLLHPCSNFPSPMEQQILLFLLYRSYLFEHQHLARDLHILVSSYVLGELKFYLAVLVTRSLSGCCWLEKNQHFWSPFPGRWRLGE